MELGANKTRESAEVNGLSAGITLETMELDAVQSPKPADIQVATSKSTAELERQEKNAQTAEECGATPESDLNLVKTSSNEIADTTKGTTSSGLILELGRKISQESEVVVVNSGVSLETMELDAVQSPKPADIQVATLKSTAELERQEKNAQTAEECGATPESDLNLVKTSSNEIADTTKGTTSSGLILELGRKISQESEVVVVNSGVSLETMELDAVQSPKPADIQVATSKSTAELERQQQSAKTAKKYSSTADSKLFFIIQPAGIQKVIPASGSKQEPSPRSAKIPEVLKSAKPDKIQGSISRSASEVKLPPSKMPFRRAKTVSSRLTLRQSPIAKPDDTSSTESQETETLQAILIDSRKSDERKMHLEDLESSLPQEQSLYDVPMVSNYNAKKPPQNLVLGHLSVMYVEIIEEAIALRLSSPALSDILENQHSYRSIALRCGCELIFSRRVVVKRAARKWIRYAILILRGPSLAVLKRFRGQLEAANPEFIKALSYDHEKPRARLLTSEHMPDNSDVAVCAERTGRAVKSWEGLSLDMPHQKYGTPIVKFNNLVLPNNEAIHTVLSYLYPNWGFKNSKAIPKSALLETSVDAAEELEKQEKQELKKG